VHRGFWPSGRGKVRASACTPVTSTVSYLPTGLAGCSVNPGISCGARKLTRPSQIKKKKIITINCVRIWWPYRIIMSYWWWISTSGLRLPMIDCNSAPREARPYGLEPIKTTTFWRQSTFLQTDKRPTTFYNNPHEITNHPMVWFTFGQHTMLFWSTLPH
jgi:hypothetical protein